MRSDAELLQDYVERDDERAFAELVERHLGLVYAAALRRTGGRAHLAEEIAQQVFTALAHKAAELRRHPVLSGWLYRSTRYVAIDAVRAEQRDQRRTETFTIMSAADGPEPAVTWERLRPVLDRAMDELKAADREVMLLRFFEGLSFAEMGGRLQLSENAARMRTERALERLRVQLSRRGVTSTAAALGLVLAPQALAGAPAGFAAQVTAAALAATAAPAAVAGVFSVIFMAKIIVPALSATLAAGLTAAAWTAFADTVSNDELATLREENTRLQAAAREPATAPALAVVADAFATQAAAVMAGVEQRFAAKNAAGAGRHRNHGQATPREAHLTFAWASDTGEVAALARVMTFDAKGRAAVQELHARLPEAVRAQYPTPEEFVAFLFIADTLLTPVPGADVLETRVATEIAPGRVAIHAPGAPPRGLEFVQTAEGWKSEVPSYYPAILVPRILSNEMLTHLNAR